MNAFADTNWLVAAYFLEAASNRHEIVERYSRRHGQPWIISQVVLLEARNVFARTAKEKNPEEWADLQSDLGRRVLVLVRLNPQPRKAGMDVFGETLSKRHDDSLCS